MNPSLRAVVTRALVGRGTLAVFLALVAGWYLPSVASEYAVLFFPIFLPAYLVTMVAYDGGMLEQVVYLLDGSIPFDPELLFEAGRVVTYYLFSVVAALVGGAVERRFGPREADDPVAPQARYVVVGILLLIGVGLFAQGVVSQPMVTSVTCEGSASAGGGTGTATATPECTETTEPATGQRLYILGLGAGIGLLGGAVVAVDRWLAGER